MPTYTHEFTTNRDELKHHEGQPFTSLSIIDEPSDTHKVEDLPLHRIRFADGTEVEAKSEEVLPEAGDVECTMVVERRYGHFKNETRAWVLIRNSHGLASAFPFEDAGEALKYVVEERRWWPPLQETLDEGLTEFWAIHKDYVRGESKFDGDGMNMVRTPYSDGVFPYATWLAWK